MESAVPILTKAIEDKIDEIPIGRIESTTLSNKTLKEGVKAIRSKQQVVILLLVIVLLVFFENIYNLFKKNTIEKS